MRELTELKEGDRVRRLLSSAAIPMDLWVVRVDGDIIHCALRQGETDEGSIYTFDKHSGVEIDERFGWGPQYGQTGSWLVGVLDAGDKTDAQLFLEAKAAKAKQQPEI